MKKAIYPISADPITNGHIDCAKRIAKQCEYVVVGIWINPDKKYTFSLQEKIEMTKKALSDILNIEVTQFSGMLVDYAMENGIDVIFRWMRWGLDFDYEKMLEEINKSQEEDIDTFFLMTKKDTSHVSSSTVKALVKEQWFVHEQVPLFVKQALEARVKWQYIMGVTGTIGAGKSFISNKFEEIGKERGVEVHNIDLDKIWHQILGELTESLYVKTRKNIVDYFGKDLQMEDGFIDRQALGKIVFEDPEKMKKLNEFMIKAFLVKIKRELYNKKGLILLNGALIIESNMTFFCNNNVVIVAISDEEQDSRLKDRWFSSEQRIQRIKSQYNFEQKKEVLDNQISKDNYGNAFVINNSDSYDEFEKEFDRILSNMDIYGQLRFESLFQRIWAKWNISKVYNKLKEIHSNQSRYYHNWTHIIDSLNELYKIRSTTEKPDAIECAIFFHDAVYDIHAKPESNERESAIFARTVLEEMGVEESFIQEVEQLIISTIPGRQPMTDSEKIMVDIDSAILSAEVNKFDKYDSNIRKEYSFYDDHTYAVGRKAVLKWILEKDQIYSTESYLPSEKKARENLQMVIDRL